MNVLILGGYGFFGRRIAAALVSQPGLQVMIGGRHVDAARAAAASLGLDATHAVAIDATGDDLGARLAALEPGLVIHTAGPFQGQRYGVARAAIDAGAHYADLADGREFVSGIVELDAAARSRNVLVTSGASSVPALSSAVVDRHLRRFAILETIHCGISSSSRTPGLATMRSVFSYCGKPFARLEDGHWRTVDGWMGSQRHVFPAPLGARWVGNCNVPDLELFPSRYPTVRTVTFRAGLPSAAAHFSVWLGARLVKWGALSTLAKFAPLFHRLSRSVERLGSDGSGMYVTMEGTASDGDRRAVSWHLLAAQNDGPFIPCGAAIALAKKLARGDPLPTGAMPCVGLIDLDEYLDALSGFHIRTILQ